MKRKIVIISFMIIMIIGMLNYSQAASFDFIANADKTEVKSGEEVTIELKVSNIDMGEKGINVIEGQLEYDNNFLENVTLISDNNWKLTYNNEEDKLKGKFLLDKMESGIKVEEKVGEIKVKVKDKAKNGETQIKIKGIKSNDGENLIDEEDRIITLKITENNTNTENQEKRNVNTGDKILLAIGIIILVAIINISIIILKRKKRK